MKQYIFPSMILAAGLLFITLAIANNSPSSKKEIIKQSTDERGLTSVVYKEGKDTFALDYLTKQEVDSLFKH